MKNEQESKMIILNDLTKNFKNMTAVNHISLSVVKGEFLTFLGPSGCGKTTTLRMIAGFEEPSGGSITLEGIPCEKLQPNKRNVNTVFQNYALFPHLSIRDNIAFGLKLKKESKKEINRKVDQIIELVKLGEHIHKKPSQLSGGQKQRVAIARSLVNEPKVLLLDEPLGALDLKLRKEMQLELKHLQKDLGITFIYVTHDQEEALTMSDRIVVMNKGNIEQIGTAEEIYERPKTKFVADFIGETNLIEGKVSESNQDSCLVLVDGEVKCVESDKNHTRGKTVFISVRPENIHFADSMDSIEGYNSINAIYEESIYIGNLMKHILYTKNNEKITVCRFTRKNERYEKGQAVQICWRAHRAVLVHDEREDED